MTLPAFNDIDGARRKTLQARLKEPANNPTEFLNNPQVPLNNPLESLNNPRCFTNLLRYSSAMNGYPFTLTADGKSSTIQDSWLKNSPEHVVTDRVAIRAS